MEEDDHGGFSDHRAGSGFVSYIPAIKDEGEVSKAFSVLSSAILQSTLEGLKENTNARIAVDEVEVDLPFG